MSIRRAIVEVERGDLNVTRFCADHGITTWFFYDLRTRFETEGEAALTPKSRAPHRVANKTPEWVEDEIVKVRKRRVEDGLDAGPQSIFDELEGLTGLPSVSTIYRILTARGFVTPEPAKAPKRAYCTFVAARANESWQLDDTTWSLADGTEVKILNIIDDHSRLAPASKALPACTGAAALSVVAEAAATLGWPARFQSDNAPAFCQVLAEALAAIGIASAHSRPYHPQTNGKVERFHQTQKRWLRRQPPAETLAELQAQLDCFRHYYNHHRRHRSLDRQTPAHVWEHAPKTGPADRPLSATTHIHRARVHGGRVQASERYLISLGSAYNGLEALTLITGTLANVFIDGRLIRRLTLNPDRRNQPLHPQPGRPRLP